MSHSRRHNNFRYSGRFDSGRAPIRTSAFWHMGCNARLCRDDGARCRIGITEESFSSVFYFLMEKQLTYFYNAVIITLLSNMGSEACGKKTTARAEKF